MSSIFPRLDPHLILTNKIEAPTVVSTIEAIKHELVLRLTQTGLGNRLQAEVIAKLADGSFIAKIADLPVHVDLPRNPAIGQKISLTLSQILPHPIFVLQESGSEVQVISPKVAPFKSETPFHDYIKQLSTERQNVKPAQTNLESTIPADHFPSSSTIDTKTGKPIATYQVKTQAQLTETPTAKDALPTTVIDAAPDALLSPAAKLISQVLKEQSGSQHVAQIRADKALVEPLHVTESPNQMKSRIAQDLRQNVHSSGLFYESHVANWLNGKLDLTELKREPQAQLPANQNTAEDTLLQSLKLKQHEQLSHLVNQQLNLLDQQSLHYQGQLTPNIPFQWTLEQKDARSSNPAKAPDEQEQYWNSKLDIELPLLGKVSIDFTLRQTQLSLSLRSEQEETVAKLNRRFPELASLMLAAGTDIVSFKSTVDHELP